MKRGRFILRLVARRELLDAVSWYDGVSPKLGDRLLQEANEGVESVFQHPERYSFTWLGARAYRLPSFPYLIYFHAKAGRIEIFAFWHEKQDASLRSRI
jgi:plasmid stabilization system protein ParE